MKPTGPTKNSTRLLVRKLEKTSIERKQAIWKTVAQQLEKPRRQQVAINLSKLNRLGKKFKGKILLVPGKVLASGVLEEKLQVAAFEFSQNAREKIGTTGGKCFSLSELVEKKEKPQMVLIVK